MGTTEVQRERDPYESVVVRTFVTPGPVPVRTGTGLVVDPGPVRSVGHDR